MNKPLNNSLTLVNSVKKILESNGITADKEQSVYYVFTFKKKPYHFLIYGLMDKPIVIKTAYSESNGTNQADRYPEQIQDIKDKNIGEILFVFDGFGFGHPKYRKCNRKIRRKIGTKNVLHLRDLNQKIADIKKASQN